MVMQRLDFPIEETIYFLSFPLIISSAFSLRDR